MLCQCQKSEVTEILLGFKEGKLNKELLTMIKE